MPQPILIQSIAVSAAWQALAASRTVMTASITTSPGNTQPVQFRVDGGPSVPWPAGVSNTLAGVDLSRIEVSGTSGDAVLVVGGMGKRPRAMSATGGGGGSGSTGIGSDDYEQRVAKNIYMKSFGLSAAWQRLADVPTVLTATLTMSPTNAQPGLVRVDGGPPATWAKGVANVFVGVDLFRIEVSGTAGDTALVVGGTW